MSLPFLPGVLAKPFASVLLFGEYHGTEEAPFWFFGCIQHALSRGQRVLVGLEMPEASTKALKAFLKDTTAQAQQTLLEAMAGFWERVQDGRSSHAMWGLVCQCRTLAQQHPGLLELAAFCPDPKHLPSFPGHTPQARHHEHGMATTLLSKIQQSKPALTLALMGNLHARGAPGAPWDPEYVPMGVILSKLLPPGAVLHCHLKAAGGQAWAMRPGEGAGIGGVRKQKVSGPRGQAVALEGPGPYQVEVNLGEVTASWPKIWREKAHALAEDS